MRNYLIRRIIQIVPVLFIISLIVFILVYVSGDPVASMVSLDASPETNEKVRDSLGLNDPLYVQYWRYVKNLVQGDFGVSYHNNEPGLSLVLERLPATFTLAIASLIVAFLIAIPFGIWSAVRRNTIYDLFITSSAVLGKAMPSFWLGIMLILLFAVKYPIFPVSGIGTVKHVVLPAIALGTASGADMARIIRSSMLDVLHQDYIRTARSKGLRNFVVINKHAIKNALNPVISMAFLQIPFLLSGAMVVEAVFSWPGLGQLLVNSVNTGDMAVVQAGVFVVALIIIVMNIIADIIYRLLDPRITYS